MGADRYKPYRTLCAMHSLDGIALVPGSNFSRLFNKAFHQNERPLLVLIRAEGAPAAVVPNLELGSLR